MRALSLNQQSALNVVGSIIVVAINILINFLLSPFIVANLGVEANGYITLANNFISYVSLITMALNSMAGRFILIESRRGNIQAANEYYSSVLSGDWILAGVLIVPLILFVAYLHKIITVSDTFLADTRILFALVIFNFLVPLVLPQWQTATYCTNNLYLRSMKNALTSIVRAVAIFCLFLLFPPHSYFVAIAAMLMTATGLLIDYKLHSALMPELKWSTAWVSRKKTIELISSGIWNTISQCGSILLEGLDVLIAILFINPVASGIMALSKLIPNMINQITGSIATTFGPRLTYLFAENKLQDMEREVNNNIKVVSFLINIPIGFFLIFGSAFFKLWVPSQNSIELAILSGIALIGLVFIGPSQSIVNVFGVVNKLRLNSIVIVCSGVVNVIAVILLLRFTSLGIYSIVCASSFISIARIFCFTAPYAAVLIGAKWHVFIGRLMFSAIGVIISLASSWVICFIIPTNSWILLISAGLSAFIISVSISFFIILTPTQRITVLNIIRLRKR